MRRRSSRGRVGKVGVDILGGRGEVVGILMRPGGGVLELGDDGNGGWDSRGGGDDIQRSC